jgi:hypothetical protein
MHISSNMETLNNLLKSLIKPAKRGGSIKPGVEEIAAFALSHASRARVSQRCHPGVPLRSTPGFMLSPATRVLVKISRALTCSKPSF